MLLEIERIGQRKMGRRRQNYYSPTSGKTYEGLYKRPGDNRWTIAATGETKRFDDEVQAIAWFTAWSRKNNRDIVAVTPEGIQSASPSNAPHWDAGTLPELDKATLAAYFRNQLLTNAVEWAELCGLPTLANFRDMPLPRKSIRLQDLIDTYDLHSEVKPRRKWNAKKIWKSFADSTKAETLRDLTADTVLRFKDEQVATGDSSETLRWRFACIKGVISFGLTRAMDAEEIKLALDKCKVLKAPKGTTKPKSHPIEVEDFHKLLAHADEFMTAAILCGLNCSLHPGEVMGMEWSEIDLARKTYCTDRSKTGVIRAAYLWDRTIEAIQKLPRKSGYVFTSPTGVAYTTGKVTKAFADLRTAAGINPETVFDWIKDGSYTASVQAKVSFELCQIHNGHKLPGKSDEYISRNPEMTKPATDAVEKHYFGTK
jgi:integrase